MSLQISDPDLQFKVPPKDSDLGRLHPEKSTDFGQVWNCEENNLQLKKRSLLTKPKKKDFRITLTLRLFTQLLVSYLVSQKTSVSIEVYGQQMA